MATDRTTAEFIEDQLAPLEVSTKRMFGEFAVYLDTKVVGFICDDILLLKITDAPADLFVGLEPGWPYPGAKDYHAVPGDRLEDRDWLREAVEATAEALPLPKPKKER
jgi:TfoX/Sxy family transcriptional regulator of competence genes